MELNVLALQLLLLCRERQRGWLLPCLGCVLFASRYGKFSAALRVEKPLQKPGPKDEKSKVQTCYEHTKSNKKKHKNEQNLYSEMSLSYCAVRMFEYLRLVLECLPLPRRGIVFCAFSFRAHSYALFEGSLVIGGCVLYAYCRLVKLLLRRPRGGGTSKPTDEDVTSPRSREGKHMRIGPFVYAIYVVLIGVLCMSVLQEAAGLQQRASSAIDVVRLTDGVGSSSVALSTGNVRAGA